MVKADRRAYQTGLLRRIVEEMRAVVAPTGPAPTGLHTYSVTRADGRRMRLHLRIGPEGGILFRDVSDVIHLNATATEMAKMALDGLSAERATAQLATRYRGVSRSQLSQELAGIYTVVDRLRDDTDSCPTCAQPDLRRAELFSTPVTAPFKVDLALTYGCNNQCPHCYNEPDRYPMASLSGAEWRRVIDKLYAVGVPHLIMTGGEATLHPELTEIIRHADGRGQVVGLNTNGRRLAHQPYVTELVRAGLNHVQITLGSCEPELHDLMMGVHAFEQTVRGIRNALASPLHTITNTTLTRANQAHALEIIRFLYDLGIRTFAMNGLISSGGGYANPDAIPEQEMPALLQQIRDTASDLGMRFLWYTPTEYCRLSPLELELGAKRCNAGEYSMCIEPNGDVLPCQSYYVTAGNILHDPWDQIWQSELFRSFRKRVAEPEASGLPRRCWDCPDLPLCAGGCRLEQIAREAEPAGSNGTHSGCASCSRGPAATGWAPSASLAGKTLRGSGAGIRHTV